MTALPRPSIGTYRLQHRLAQGGMGAVFEAIGPSGRVAIKLLHAEHAGDAEMRRRFQREASILRSLDHPGIVRVLDVGTDGAAVYTVMELLEGETLEAQARRRPIAPEALCSIISDIADALEAVHEHGVLHGDLKPANVFLVDGRAKLVDFGTSKIHGLERLTRTGELAGTPAFMAPELITGEEPLSPAIDVYGLGVLTYFCLSGRLPFTERNPGRLMFQIVMGEATPLTTHVPHLAAEISPIVGQAMATGPSQRPSPRTFAERFRKACE